MVPTLAAQNAALTDLATRGTDTFDDVGVFASYEETTKVSVLPGGDTEAGAGWDSILSGPALSGAALDFQGGRAC